MQQFVALGEIHAGWARGRLNDPEAGAQESRQALADFFNQGNRFGAPGYHGFIAELEVATRGPDSALTLVERGLAIAEETGERFVDPYLHRLRGDILLKRDAAHPAPAEQAFQTAIAIAKEQGARSYVLLASLSLAKLYQSTGRQVDAHAVLAPALDGFPALSLLPFGRRAGDEGTLGSNETADALIPNPSPARERGDARAEMPEIAEAEALLAALGQ
jgi:predicted ATPase